MSKRLVRWSCASLLLAVLTNCGGGSPDLFPLGPCADDPCVHGSCVPEAASGTDSFTCECDEGWTGERCSTPDEDGGTGGSGGGKGGTSGGSGGTMDGTAGAGGDACDDVSCGNGSCVAEGDGYVCDCDLGWAGEHCDDVILCEEEPGEHCDDVILCEEEPCVHGTCTDGATGFTCECDLGWSGPLCDVDTGECDCHESATCIDDAGSVTCKCDDGFEGDGHDCEPIVCGALDDPQNGEVVVEGVSPGSVATYECDHGYEPSHSESRTCQASGEWSGSAPTCEAVVCEPMDLIEDPSFEAGSGGPWSEGSEVFGTAICNEAACGNAGGLGGPRTGDLWAWLGGTGSSETAWVEQDVLIPTQGPHHLSFWLKVSHRNGSSTMEVRVDDETVRVIPEPPADDAEYVQYTVDLSAFADGAEHTIRFHYVSDGVVSNFHLDDVTLECTPPVAVP